MSTDDSFLPEPTPVPSLIYAKVHGASRDFITGERSLLGGWQDCPRDGHVAMVPKAQVDAMRVALSHVSGILAFICKERILVREATRFVIAGGDGSNNITIKAALDAADAALGQSGEPL